MKGLVALSSSIASLRVGAIPPHAYFVVSAVFHYLGPAFAVLLFARVDVLGVAWLRIATAAAVFALWRRPWRLLSLLDSDGRRLLIAITSRNAAALVLAVGGVHMLTGVRIEGEPLAVGPALVNAVGWLTNRSDEAGRERTGVHN